MKKKTNYEKGARRLTACRVFVALLAVWTVSILACKKATMSENLGLITPTGAVFAETKGADLNVLEALQEGFRSIAKSMLPAVVEVDVVETKTVNTVDPFEDFRRFFFGPGDGDDDERERKPRTRKFESKGLGSGVIVRKTNNTFYVLTNNHVAGDATKITVKLNDEREFTGKLVGADSRMDIALVSFESPDSSIAVAPLGDSDTVMAGDICFAMGAPLGFSQSVTQGIVSAKGRSGAGIGNINDFIQTDAAINQGNSGGPLVNIRGEVIGINTWIASQSGGSQGLGFSIPINNIRSAIDSFIDSGKLVYGWLGVSLYPLNDDFKKALGLESSAGALVTQVFQGSPAQKSGFVVGDFITAISGTAVKDVESVQRIVGRIPAGKTVPFDIVRSGAKITLQVKIEERTEKTASDNGKLWPGFFAAPITDELKEKYELDEKTVGVIVTDVMPKTPAAALRLQAGDVITAVNGKAIKNLQEFYDELARAKSSVNFDIYSNGGTITTGTYKF